MTKINPAISILTTLGAYALIPIIEFGRTAIFMLEGIFHIFSFPLQIRKFMDQLYFIGAKSILIVLLTGIFTGMVLGLQGYYTLVQFGAEGVLGAAVALSLIREMGPVLTAIMVIARAGSAMAAEIGIMRISEQIDALETMNINPVRFLFSPRLAATLLSFPLLTAIFDVVGIFGGYVTGVLLLGMSPGVYFSRVESSVTMGDITGGFIKAIVFGLMIATISCAQGYYTHLKPGGHGAKGVSLATTSAVVFSCTVVLMADFVITTFLM